METTSALNNKNDRTNGVLIHLSGFLKYTFPLLFLIVPILIWSKNRENDFVDNHGRQAINFQLSMLLYSVLLTFVFLGFFFYFIIDLVAFIEVLESGSRIIFPTWMLWIGLIIGLFATKSIFEIVVTIIAAFRASNGKEYHYPLSISFLKTKS